MSGSNTAVLDAPAKWESEDEFEARLKRIETNAQAPARTEGGEAAPATPELAALLAENQKLKTMAEEARRRVTQLEQEASKTEKREADFELMLEEKSEEIRRIEKELNEFKSKQSTGVTEEELLALHSELERERVTLDEDRQAMEEQFRQLELNMSRERAEIARERNEMARMKSELKHKLEQMEKTAAQGDLSPLRRLRDEISGNQPAAGTRPNLPNMPNLPAMNRRAPEGESSPKRSGILSKFLGAKDE